MVIDREGAGFTLVEVLVSAALLVIAAAGIAQLTMLAAEACEAARARTSTALIAAQKMEQLRSLAWSRDASGQPVSDTSTDVSREPLAAGANGLRAGPPDTLAGNVGGYVDYLDAAGAWVGSGAGPPPSAVFVRRWAVLALEADPDNARVLIVIARTMKQERARVAAGAPVRWQDDAMLVALRTRQAAP